MTYTMLALAPVAALVLAAGPAPRGHALVLATTPGMSSDALSPDNPASAPGAGSAYQPAPVPDRDLSAPLEAANAGPSLDPTLFTPHQQFRGDGFTPGSTEQSVAQKNMAAAPGFNLKVPLETLPRQQLQP